MISFSKLEKECSCTCGMYVVDRNMTIQELNKIGPYIYELIIEDNKYIEELNIEYFYNLKSLDLYRNEKITSDGIRRTSEGKSPGLHLRDLINLKFLNLQNTKEMSYHSIITDDGIRDLINLT